MVKRLLAIILVILLATLCLPIPAMASGGSVVGTVGNPPRLSLQEESSFVWVDNGQLMVSFYKGSAGYDYIADSQSLAPLIYNNQFSLEYLQGKTWKQRGVPVSVSYKGDNKQGYTITRHYDDFLGTTYDIDYLVRAGQPIKITIRIHSGQAGTYNLVWSPSGITTTDCIESNSRLDFDSVSLDWSDAWQFTASSSVDTSAAQKKATIIFSLGALSAGQNVTIDPSVVGTSTNNGAVSYSPQRKSFYAEGRYWAFYYNGTRIVFSSSTDGINWAAPTNDVTVEQGYQFSLWFDGTYVHEINCNAAADLGYRRGDPVANGTITWSQVEQTLPDTGSYYIPTICIDSGGHAWVGYRDVTGYPWVTRNDSTDGTWSTTDGFPYQLDNAAGTSVVVSVPLASEKVYVMYVTNDADDKLDGILYDAGWGAEETSITDISPISAREWSATSNGSDEVYVTWLKTTTIYFDERVGGAWGVDATVATGVDAKSYPVISHMTARDDDVAIFYPDHNTDHVYYRTRISNNWGAGVTDWIDASGDALADYESILVCDANSASDHVGVVYVSKEATPWNVNFASLSVSYEAAPTVQTNAADDITFTTATLNGEVTDDGGLTIDYYGFVWDTVADAGDPGDSDPSVPPAGWEFGWKSGAGDYGENPFDHGITGLPDGTTIYFRAAAHNSEGWAYGDVNDFPTDAYTAPDVTTDPASDISYTTATLNGVITNVYGDNATVRGFRWGTTFGGPYPSDWHENGSYGAAPFSHGLTLLDAGEDYYYEVYATNLGGTTYGAEEHFATTAYGAPTVINSAADNITGVGADLHGEITDVDGDNATIRGFKWDTDAPGAPYANDWHENGSWGASTFSHTFTDMPAVTTIYWIAYATNSGGTGESGELNFDTLLPLPGPPTNLVITQTGIDEVTLTWLTGTDAATTRVMVKEDNYPDSTTDGFLVYDGALETATCNGLNLTTQSYYFRAWSHNATGYSTDTADGQIGGSMILLGIVTFLAMGMMASCLYH